MQKQIALGDFVVRWSERRPDGTPIVAVHSSGMSSRQWRKLESELPDGLRLVAPDLVGYGESSRWPDDERFHFVLDQLAIERVLEALDEPAHLVGHSYGGFLALLVALHHPSRVRSLSVFEPVSFGVLRSTGDTEALATLPPEDAPWPAGPEQLEAWLEGFVDYWNGPGGWRAQSDGFRETFRAAGMKMVGEVKTLGLEATPHIAYRTLTMPVALLGGERSTLAAKRVLERLAREIPNAERVEIPSAGHMGPLTHASEVNARIFANIARAR